jgi:hypothetical protein
MFGDFDTKQFDVPTTADGGEEVKTYELESYGDYLAALNSDKKKTKTTKPKEQEDNTLKILVFKTNKADIKQRPLMESKIIPAHPFRMLMIGRSGSGKSMNLVNLMTRAHMYGPAVGTTSQAVTKLHKPREPRKKPKGYFDLVWLFSPTAEGGDDLVEHLDLDENKIITSEDQFGPVLDHILKTQKALIAKKSLTESPKILLIFDDCQSAESFLRSQNFLKIFIAGRHYNISIIACGQSFTKFPRATRLQASNIVLYPSSGSEVDLLVDEFTPPNKTKKQMLALVSHATHEPFNFLHINNQVQVGQRYRKNYDTLLSI